MLKDSRSSKIFAGAVAAALTLAAFASLALAAAEQTRESYVAAVEPICKTNVKANERFLGGVEKEVKQGKLKLAGTQVAKANAAGKKAVTQIKAVPMPAADATKLTKWIGYLEREQKLLGEISTALKANKKARVQSLRVQLTHNGTLANDEVLGFEFHYCHIETGKLG